MYVSTSEGVLASPDHFDQVFNNIITVRQAELAFTLRRLPTFIKRQVSGQGRMSSVAGCVLACSGNDFVVVALL